MTRTTHQSKYFYGNRISEYGLAHGYLDYATLAKAFDVVMVNDITKLFYSTVNREYVEPEQINGYIDNFDEIEELKEALDDLNLYDPDNTDKITEIEEQIKELEHQQDNSQEIYQYFIVSANGADIIQEYTNDPLFYIEYLNMYIWGVTHWGTSWDYVLTDVKLELAEV